MKNYLPKTSGYSLYSQTFAKVADFLLTAICGITCFSMYFPLSIFYYERYQWMIAASSVVIVILMSWSRVYVSWRGKVRTKLIFRLLKGYFFLGCLILAYLFFFKKGEDFSRAWVLLWLSTSFISSVLVRLVVYRLLGLIRKKGKNARKIVLIGDANSCKKILKSIKDDETAGYWVEEIRCNENVDAGKILVKRIDDDSDLNVHEAWICLPLEKSELFNIILDRLRLLSIEIRYLPDMQNFHLVNYQVSYVAGHYALDLNISPMHGYKRILKTIEDKVLSSIGLVIAFPIMLITGIAVYLNLGRPIFFKQQRVSWNGKRFTIYKFRSMPVADNDAIWGNANIKTTSKFGSFLRKSNLDELPQLWNVLKGDMSMVGPRPEQAGFVEKFKHEIPGYMQKHMVKAGITGWAQVNGLRGDTDLEKRIEYDIWYIKNWNLILDIKIIIKTISNFNL